MKRFAVMLLAAAVLAMGLGACIPVDSEPEPVIPVEDPYSDPETAPLWLRMAYRGDAGLLNSIRKEGGPETLWWVDDGVVAELYGEDVFPDGVYYEGVFQFTFSTREEPEKLAALAGYPEDQSRRITSEWPWNTWELLSRHWTLAVTIQPMRGEAWPTPGFMIPPELSFVDWITVIGDDHFGGNPMLDAYEAGELLIDDPQHTNEYQMPQFTPVDGHEGYDLAVTHATPDGRPLQVRLRWKNEEGFGFWAQLPGYALDTFWEHEDEWFIKVNVSGAESGGDGIG